MTRESVRIINRQIFLYLSLIVIAALMVIDLERLAEMMIGYFFIIPAILSYFTERSRTIFLVAALSTAASLIGFLCAPAGFNNDVAINRSFSLSMVWVVASLGNCQVLSNGRLAQDRNRLQPILENLPVGVATSDSKGRLDEANSQMDKIWREVHEGPELPGVPILYRILVWDGHQAQAGRVAHGPLGQPWGIGLRRSCGHRAVRR